MIDESWQIVNVLPKQKNIECRNAKIQISTLEEKSVSTQQPERKNIPIQTASYLENIKHEKNDKNEEKNLLKFLKDVSPIVMKNLNKCNDDGYIPFWEDRCDDVTLLHDFLPDRTNTHASGVENKTSKDDLVGVSSICWNCTGSCLAMSYGGMGNNLGWNDSRGKISFWNMFDRDNIKPNLTIYSDTPITSINFHPSQPSLIAGGSYVGEIFIWDKSLVGDKIESSDGTQPNEPLVCSSGLNDYFHRHVN
eukprot:GHVL01010104.1.p1 GENE.GHVL01010104.1~~GHVL01010104.1.p1  ORF type:complete len:250 (+),score=57.67 GHVL01010104.1:74-823(+)